MKIVIKILGLITFAVIAFLYLGIQDQAVFKYFEDFDVYLKGEIVHIEEWNSSRYIIELDVDSSNYKLFNQSDSLEVFYCLVDNDFAVIYDYVPEKVEIGTIVEIKGKEKSVSFYDHEMTFLGAHDLVRTSDKSYFPREELVSRFKSGSK